MGGHRPRGPGAEPPWLRPRRTGPPLTRRHPQLRRRRPDRRNLDTPDPHRVGLLVLPPPGRKRPLHEPARSAGRRRQGHRPRGSDLGGRRRQPHARRPGRPARRPALRDRRPGPRDGPPGAGGDGDGPRGGGPGGGAALLLPPEGIVEYPSWETLPHERLSPRSDTVGRRLAVLRRLAHPRPDDPGPARSRSSSHRCAPCSSRRSRAWATWSRWPCAPGRAPTWRRSSRRWRRRRYARVELVEKRGEFAVRGGILDVFPPTEEHPLRVEFWGRRASRRSATSRSPTSVPWRSPNTACGPRPAVSCC